MSKGKNYVPVAAIHTHFNIFRNIHEGKTGPITLDEQIVAVERFVRWHERQVAVGQQLLARLKGAAPQDDSYACRCHLDCRPFDGCRAIQRQKAVGTSDATPDPGVNDGQAD